MSTEISLHDALFAIQSHLEASDFRTRYNVGDKFKIVNSRSKYFNRFASLEDGNILEVVKIDRDSFQCYYKLFCEKTNETLWSAPNAYKLAFEAGDMEEYKEPADNFSTKFSLGDKFIILKDVSASPLYGCLKLPVGYVTTIKRHIETESEKENMSYALSSEDFDMGLWVYDERFKKHLESGAIALFKDVLKEGFEFYITDEAAWKELVGYGRYKHKLPEGKACIKLVHEPSRGETLVVMSYVSHCYWHYREDLVMEAFEKGFATIVAPKLKKEEPAQASVPFYDRFEVGDTFKVLHDDVEITPDIRDVFESGTTFKIACKEGRGMTYLLHTFPALFSTRKWCDNDKFEAALAEGKVIKVEEGCSMSFPESSVTKTIVLDGVKYFLTKANLT